MKIACLVCAAMLPAVAQAQFTYATNSNQITITGDTNIPVNGVVVIPSTILVNGVSLPVTGIGDYAFLRYNSLISVEIPDSVTSIGNQAFWRCGNLTSVVMGNCITSIGDNAFERCINLSSITIPNSVTNLGNTAFYGCGLSNAIIGNRVPNIGVDEFSGNLFSSITIPNSVTNIGDYAFFDCTSLSSVIIPNSVINIGNYAFWMDSSLTSITIPNSLTNIGNEAFYDCTSLNSVYFKGNAPSIGSSVFGGGGEGVPIYTTAYYLLGTTGWDNFNSNSGLNPVVLWNPQVETGDASFGVQTNQFRFEITGGSNLVVVVEACTDLANPVWSPVSTNTLNTFIGTNGTSHFSDSQWTNCPSRFYRLRSP